MLSKRALKTTLPLILLAGSTCGGAEQVRQWTDDSGQFSIWATLQGTDGNRVYLTKRDNRVIDVPLVSLSEHDKRYVIEHKVRNLFSKLRQHDGDVADSAKLKLTKIAAEEDRAFLTPVISSYLNHRHPNDVRIVAANCLASIGPDASGAAERLLQMQGDDTAAVSKAATLALRGSRVEEVVDEAHNRINFETWGAESYTIGNTIGILTVTDANLASIRLRFSSDFSNISKVSNQSFELRGGAGFKILFVSKLERNAQGFSGNLVIAGPLNADAFKTLSFKLKNQEHWISLSDVPRRN